MTPLLQVQDLSIRTHDPSCAPLVDRVHFSLAPGEICALVGESGCGKSLSALALMGLLPAQSLSTEGSITLDGRALHNLTPTQWQAVRGKEMAMIFQEPMTALNPLHTIGKQLAEAITLHRALRGKKLQKEIDHLLEQVELEELTTRLEAYPHELSGGQRQRVMIAMALAHRPKLLIADEPTTALDVTVQKEILHTLLELRKTHNMALLLITHDLSLVRHMADRVLIMQQGKLLEQGTPDTLWHTPQHAYTKTLLGATELPMRHAPKEQVGPALQVKQLCVRFPLQLGLLGQVKQWKEAVREVAFTLPQGQTLALVGESGCGKPTLALAVLRLLASSGEIWWHNEPGTTASLPLHRHSTRAMRPLRQQLQYVFQDPFSSLNPRLNIRRILLEGLEVHGIPRAEHEARLKEALAEVELEPDILSRYPHAFSGGQRQRIGLARALVLRPQLLVLDEPTSALDVITQARILKLLCRLQETHGLSYLFISHDLRAVRAIAHEVAVMEQGSIIETATTSQLFSAPAHPTTKRLLDAAMLLP